MLGVGGRLFIAVAALFALVATPARATPASLTFAIEYHQTGTENCFPPYQCTVHYEGVALGSDGRVWTLTQTVDLGRPYFTPSHGVFRLATAGDAISGTIYDPVDTATPLPVGVPAPTAEYTVTAGEGAYGSCASAPADMVNVTIPLLPTGSITLGTVSFSLSC